MTRDKIIQIELTKHEIIGLSDMGNIYQRGHLISDQWILITRSPKLPSDTATEVSS